MSIKLKKKEKKDTNKRDTKNKDQKKKKKTCIIILNLIDQQSDMIQIKESIFLI